VAEEPRRLAPSVLALLNKPMSNPWDERAPSQPPSQARPCTSCGERSAAPTTAPRPRARPRSQEKWINDLREEMCPEEKARLADMKARGVTITAYDKIYFDDQLYDGTKWTTKRFVAGGTTEGNAIQLLRSDTVRDDATTLVHENIHTQQPASMSWADKEYDAYSKTEQWRVDRGLPETLPGFQTTVNGRATVNESAVHDLVDRYYPTTPSTATDSVAAAVADTVVGRTPTGDSILTRGTDGSTFTRPPQLGDTYPGLEVTNPPGGIPVDIDDLQCEESDQGETP
jgi:hypothetical protein